METHEIVILGVAVLLFGSFVLRWIFSISRLVRELEANRKLQSLIAKHKGIDEEKINEINKIADAREMW